MNYTTELKRLNDIIEHEPIEIKVQYEIARQILLLTMKLNSIEETIDSLRAELQTLRLDR